ncbi:DUF4209 domain-containing protein [Nonomuraea fuscirosea]|uniref:DUF4209 domain-containing protein n=1 Tax=Nonomuraea fuscirosea TaxID=1291556 RepID=UPI00344116CA
MEERERKAPNETTEEISFGGKSPEMGVGQLDTERLIKDIASAIQRAAEAERRSDFDFQQRVQAELAPLLAAAAPSDGGTGSDGDTNLKESNHPPAVAMIDSARWAFAYMLALNPPKPGEWSFSPRLEYADGTAYPPRIETISEDILSIWHELALRVSAPAATARLEHLLFERRHKSNRERIRRAIAAYLKLPELWLESRLDATAALRHALHIARKTKQDDMAQQTLAAMCQLAKVSLTAESAEPGVTLRLIETMLEDREPPSELEDLIQMAGGTYSDVWNADHIVKYKLRLAAKNGSSTAPLHAERVDLWLDAAAASEGIVRSRHLLEAVKVARESGDSALVGKATGQLQAMRAEDMKLQEISTGARLHSIEVDRALAPIIEADTLSVALTTFALFGPVSGDVVANRATVEAQAREFPISNLFPVHRLGADNMPRYFANSDEDKAEYRLAQYEEMNISFGAGVLAEGLVRIAQKFGIPSEAELAGHFMINPIIDVGLAAALARAFQRFWVGDPEGAAFTAAPRVEALARNLLLVVDEPIYRTQRANTPGQYPGLGALLAFLKAKGVNESWYRFIYTLCANPAGGPNLRNDISHGFISFVNTTYAALLLQAAAYLATLQPGRAEPVDPGHNQDG